MSDISIVLILIAVGIFAAGYVTARIVAHQQQLRERTRQALRDAVERPTAADQNQFHKQKDQIARQLSESVRSALRRS